MPESPQLVVAPVFLFPVLTTVLSWLVVIVAFVFTVEFTLPEYNEWVKHPGVIGMLMGFILLIAVMQYLGQRKMEYLIYSDRIEYHESFFTLDMTSTPMRRIISITLRYSPIDLCCGTGTITFFPIGQDKGVVIPYVHNPKETFATLLELQDKSIPTGPVGELRQWKE